MTDLEVYEIVKAIKDGVDVQVFDTGAKEWVDYTKEFGLNFRVDKFRIKPKEPEQPEIVKTEITWDNNSYLIHNIMPKELKSDWQLGDIDEGYRLVEFEFKEDSIVNKPYPITPSHEMVWNKSVKVYKKATHAIWERVK